VQFGRSHAGVKATVTCLVVECVVFLLFLAGLRNAAAALYWTVIVGPVSVFAAPFIYRSFKNREGGQGNGHR
jgi:hypothetical protein